MRKKVLASCVFFIMAMSMLSGCGQKAVETSAITQEEDSNSRLNISELRADVILGDYLVDRPSRTA